MSATEKLESAEAWRELARELRVAILDHWNFETDPKSELRLLRVVRVIDAIDERDRKEGRK